ncbi:MAG: Fe-S cluster assembly ATPase SufC [Candidatus Cardinium sp.]|uniref:Fe-S cluster assembly ATPase SufC n=1 Tax=Cardinium endosymbiont of Dermatophagoides farinae TaxID=2597823 RepID=UPI001184404E|nr:Fe-S cluster assembly ATPase SufC [Cardinium endosymbiont of Dermatophagoides farinae]TSJ80671.1 Fe-S cluster assembly ATPase SufC [Cardinium endosymbiont of Dermatophagoides farinae]UWW96663.1 MAG: Fe-S cluster assembly ATPase SufC [Candidatus Cardinium sp.]
MLTIADLHVHIGSKKVLNGVSLQVDAGQVHAIMGPNGAGKSTLAAVLAGKPGYEVTGGRILLHGQDLLQLAPEARAALGLFLAFQYPVEIPGVTTTNFLKTAINQIRKQGELPPLDAVAFLALLKEKRKLLRMDDALVQRSLNEGFSGGEKKRNEMLQMAVLDPSLAILDETDSGLDIDALTIVAQAINQLRGAANAMVLITHYQRLLDHVVPDVVHIFYDGKIIASGDYTLAKRLEKEGYAWITKLHL